MFQIQTLSSRLGAYTRSVLSSAFFVGYAVYFDVIKTAQVELRSGPV